MLQCFYPSARQNMSRGNVSVLAYIMIRSRLSLGPQDEIDCCKQRHSTCQGSCRTSQHMQSIHVGSSPGPSMGKKDNMGSSCLLCDNRHTMVSSPPNTACSMHGQNQPLACPPSRASRHRSTSRTAQTVTAPQSPWLSRAQSGSPRTACHTPARTPPPPAQPVRM